MKTEINRAIALVNRVVKGAAATLERFSHDFASNPAAALEGSQRAFDAAAKKRVGERVLALFAAGASPAEVLADLESALLSNARHPERSTSFSSNEMSRSTLAAQAELLWEIRVEMA